jgi:hypothetical protein
MEGARAILVLGLLAQCLVRPVESGVVLVEGDMAVAAPREADPSIGDSFVVNQNNLWAEGRVPYR